MSSDGDADGDTIDAPESDALSPYTLQREEASETRHAFWADTVADRVAKAEPGRADRHQGRHFALRGPHLGNVNEIMRGYFVAEVLRDRGHEVRQVFTADDRDPFESSRGLSVTSRGTSSISERSTQAHSAGIWARPTPISRIPSAAVTPTATTLRRLSRTAPTPSTSRSNSSRTRSCTSPASSRRLRGSSSSTKSAHARFSRSIRTQSTRTATTSRLTRSARSVARSPRR